MKFWKMGTAAPDTEWLQRYWACSGWGEKAELAIPSIVTLIGLISGIYFVTGGSVIFAALSLLADYLDGWAARALCAQSRFGANLDYITDLCLAILCMMTITSPWVLIAFVPIWAYREPSLHYFST